MINIIRNTSILDFSYYVFMAVVPLEIVGTMYLKLGFSLSVPAGVFFAFSYLFLQKKNNSISWPWQMNLPLIWIFVVVTHYVGSTDLYYFGSVTGVFNNIIFSVILYNYLLRSQNFYSGLLAMGVSTALAACGFFATFGMDILRGDRFTFLDFDENNFGSIMALGALILFMLSQDRSKSIRRNSLLLLMAIITVGVVIATGSRGAMLAFGLALLFYFAIFFSKQLFKLRSLVVIIVIIGSFIYFFQQSSTTQKRWESTFHGSGREVYSSRDIITMYAIDMILEQPVLGWGIKGSFKKLGREVLGTEGYKGTHNTFIMIFVTSGIVGGVPFVFFLGYPFSQLKLQFNNTQYKQVIVLLVFVLLVFMTLDWLNRKQLWVFYSMLLANLAHLSSPLVSRGNGGSKYVS